MPIFDIVRVYNLRDKKWYLIILICISLIISEIKYIIFSYVYYVLGFPDQWMAFFFLRFFWCGPFLKSLLILLQSCFCFMFCFFGHEACGILAPWPVIEPAPPALEGEVLTTGPPGKTPSEWLFLVLSHFFSWHE